MKTRTKQTTTKGTAKKTKTPPAKAAKVRATKSSATAAGKVKAVAPPPAATVPVPVEASAKLSCLDAAAEVLRGAAGPMRCRELITAMAARGLWASPAATPHQTLAAALQREIARKGPAGRFRKAGRGAFALNA